MVAIQPGKNFEPAPLLEQFNGGVLALNSTPYVDPVVLAQSIKTDRRSLLVATEAALFSSTQPQAPWKPGRQVIRHLERLSHEFPVVVVTDQSAAFVRSQLPTSRIGIIGSHGGEWDISFPTFQAHRTLSHLGELEKMLEPMRYMLQCRVPAQLRPHIHIAEWSLRIDWSTLVTGRRSTQRTNEDFKWRTFARSAARDVLTVFDKNDNFEAREMDAHSLTLHPKAADPSLALKKLVREFSPSSTIVMAGGPYEASFLHAAQKLRAPRYPILVGSDIWLSGCYGLTDKNKAQTFIRFLSNQSSKIPR